MPHDADAVGRDWGGYLEKAGLQRESSPFYVQPVSKTYGSWAGEPPVSLPVKVVITYPGGRREALKILPVFLSRVRLGLLDDRMLPVGAGSPSAGSTLRRGRIRSSQSGSHQARSPKSCIDRREPGPSG